MGRSDRRLIDWVLRLTWAGGCAAGMVLGVGMVWAGTWVLEVISDLRSRRKRALTTMIPPPQLTIVASDGSLHGSLTPGARQ